jgi:ABC-type glycerol-3-phosphate transport system permease component
MRIFISYRRADSRSFTERIADVLTVEFGTSNIFQDVDDIPAGEDFRRVLREAVQSCDAVLVVVGRQWLTVTDEAGQRRLDDPNDFVRIEVESALTQDKLLIPLLVDNAAPLDASALPPSMRELAYRNVAPIRYNPDFSGDMGRLIRRLRTFESELQARQEAERQAREVAERQAREAAEREARLAAEAQAREQAQRQREAAAADPQEKVMESVQKPRVVVPPLRALFVQVCALAFAGIFIYPLFWAISTSFRTLEETDSVGWSISSASGRALGNSIAITVMVALVTVVIAVPTAYGWARLSSVGARRRLLVLLFLPRLVPSIAIVIPVFLLFRSINLYNNVFGQVIATSTLALPFATWILGDTFRHLLNEKAQDILPGIAQLRRLLTNEAGRSALLAAFAVGLLVGWQEFLFALILNSQQGRAIMVEVLQRRAQASSVETLFPETAALSILTGIVTALIVSLFARRYLARWLGG